MYDNICEKFLIASSLRWNFNSEAGPKAREWVLGFTEFSRLSVFSFSLKIFLWLVTPKNKAEKAFCMVSIVYFPEVCSFIFYYVKCKMAVRKKHILIYLFSIEFVHFNQEVVWMGITWKIWKNLSIHYSGWHFKNPSFPDSCGNPDKNNCAYNFNWKTGTWMSLFAQLSDI